jgi:cytidyltransferase-like protein
METAENELWRTKFQFKAGELNGILFAFGSFAPIHLNHLRMMDAAKVHVEETLGIHVAGGFLQPSPDSNLQRKLNGQFLPLEHRKAMTQLATEGTIWDVPSLKLEKSSSNLILTAWEQKIRNEMGHQVQIFYVCGADTANKTDKFLNKRFQILAIQRNGYREPRRRERIHCVENFEDTMSSTEIRKRMLTGQPVNHFLHSRVLEYFEVNQLKKYL